MSAKAIGTSTADNRCSTEPTAHKTTPISTSKIASASAVSENHSTRACFLVGEGKLMTALSAWIQLPEEVRAKNAKRAKSESQRTTAPGFHCSTTILQR